MAIWSSVLRFVTRSDSARSTRAPVIRSAEDCADARPTTPNETSNNFINKSLGRNGAGGAGPVHLLTGHHALAVGAILLTVEIARVRRRMEREDGQRGHIVLIHA